jgi:dihydrofolate synthase / folylpolyglutamate synthase
MRFTSLDDWLGWLEQSHPKEIDLGLDRIRQVAERLDLLSPRAKVVTVAGTNGKGSCVTATAGLL